MGILQTEHDFTLPMGYVDEAGTLHRDGKMRLATAADEILPMKDPRVQNNPAYLTVILLSRVVTSLGSLKMVNPRIIEGLFAGDFAYLQEMYTRINQNGSNVIKTVCPKCEHKFDVEVQSLGE
ncbi:MAG: phage tail assembly protein [Candidatus Methanoperedens sp.]|nr:phage tail assembly protein [Candidatus Methanoperedens sp.]